MFSKTCEYALRAILYIAINSLKGQKTGLKEVAEKLELPAHFLGKILQNLVRQNIISSLKGPTGGFFIDEDGMKINIFEIVRAVDGIKSLGKCGLGLKECSDSHPCPIHNEFAGYRDNLMLILKRKTIRDLAEEIKVGHAFLINDVLR